MNSQLPGASLQLMSTLTPAGVLEIELAETAVRAPGPDEVVVQVEAAPINPSDLLSLVPRADLSQARFEGPPERPKVFAPLTPEAAQALAARVGQPLAVGLEGAGTVIAAGANVQRLLGRRVAVWAPARGMFAQYRTVAAADCVPLPEGTTAEEGAALFVNPLTALAIVETMSLEGYAGLVHTAAASNLGQMLVKVCLEDGVPLVAVVRKAEQAELLQGLGATHVCNSSLPSFREDLVQALKETGAMLAFDALGGGRTPGQILSAMEAAAASRMAGYSPYGSSERKHVYVYGRLEPSPMEFTYGGYGMTWGVSGWMMPPILQRIGPERAMGLRQRVLDGLKTTFASRYARKISLAEALRRDTMLAYARKATGEKFLIDPTL